MDNRNRKFTIKRNSPTILSSSFDPSTQLTDIMEEPAPKSLRK